MIKHPLILTIETTSANCGIAISSEKMLIGSVNILQKNIHDKLLAKITKELADNCNVNLNYINAIGLNTGPGSYTGIRIGIAFVKGLCFSNDIKFVPLNTHDIIFNNLKKIFVQRESETFLVITKTFTGSYYVKKYELSDKGFDNSGTKIEISEKTEIENIIASNPKIIIAGDGSDDFVYSNKFDYFNLIKAEDLIELTYDYLINNNYVNAADYAPDYLLDFRTKYLIK